MWTLQAPYKTKIDERINNARLSQF